MNTEARIPLSLLPRELAKRTGQPPLSYRRLYSAAVDGALPAERGSNGRWTVAQGDLDAIAAAFGLVPKATSSAIAAWAG